MANIRDVAEQSGVSIGAVSRILNNDPTYSATDSTREKVYNTAAMLNYVINPSYRKGKDEAKKRNSISCIINLTSEKHDDSYYTTILSGIISELKKHNYIVDYIKSQFDITNDLDIINSIAKGPSKGLILMTTPSHEAISLINRHKIKVVGIDTSVTEIDNIRYNRFEAGCKAMQCLIQNGHKKIAFIGSHIPDAFNISFGRYDAYCTMMKKYDLSINPDWVVDCLWQRQLCFNGTEKLISIDDRPTAIFFASDYMAIASLSAIYGKNLKVPDDISIIGISNIDEAKYLTPPLTTIDIPQYEIGKIAARTLLSRINGDTTLPKQIYIPTSLIERQSIKLLR